MVVVGQQAPIKHELVVLVDRHLAQDLLIQLVKDRIRVLSNSLLQVPQPQVRHEEYNAEDQ